MDTDLPSRLDSQLAFLLEADKLKNVNRANSLSDGSRRENSAEHSWHVTLMAMVLAEHCPEPICLCRVLELLTVHDLVEVHAGDTLIYDEEALKGQADREAAGAVSLFSLLPPDQGERLHGLWREFEERTTPEARFARAVDAFAPTWLHWGEHSNPEPDGLATKAVILRKKPLLEAYPELWKYFLEFLQSAEGRGLLISD